MKAVTAKLKAVSMAENESGVIENSIIWRQCACHPAIRNVCGVAPCGEEAAAAWRRRRAVAGLKTKRSLQRRKAGVIASY
jgi:hypothetical protein